MKQNLLKSFILTDGTGKRMIRGIYGISRRLRDLSAFGGRHLLPASWENCVGEHIFSPVGVRKGKRMATVTKKELVDRIAEVLKYKRVIVKRVTQQFLDEIIAELGKGNRLEFRDFGVFESKLRAA